MSARHGFGIVVLGVVVGIGSLAQAQTAPPCSCCAMAGQAGEGQMCPMHDMMATEGAAPDMQLLHRLFEHRDKIERQVMNLPNGIHTTTRSTDPEIAKALRTHVASMVTRLKDGRPLDSKDPFFAEVFKNAKSITISAEPFNDGVHVIETSDDPYTVKLLQEHAGIVNAFIERGMSEMHRDHTVPKRD